MKKIIIFAVSLFALAFATAPAYAQKTTSTQIKYTFEKKRYKVRYQGEVNVGYSNTLGIRMDYDYAEKYVYRNKDEGTKWSNSLINKVSINTIHGLRFTKWLFMGIGLGVDYSTLYLTPNLTNLDGKDQYPIPNHLDKPCNLWQMPFFGNIRLIWPVSDDISLYFNANVGGTAHLGKIDFGEANPDESGHIYYENARFTCKYYGEYGIGLTYKLLNFSLGFLQEPIKYDYEFTYGSNYEHKTYAYSLNINSVFFKVGIRFGRL